MAHRLCLSLWRFENKISFGINLMNVETMSLLTIVYIKQGKPQEAERLRAKVLELTKQVFGSEHPDTLQAIENLAFEYMKRGKLDDAENLQMEVLELSKRMFGPENLTTLVCASNLAFVHCEQGKLGEAKNYIYGSIGTHKAIAWL